MEEGDQLRFEVDPKVGRSSMEPVKHRVEDLGAFAIHGAKRMSFQDMGKAKRAGGRGLEQRHGPGCREDSLARVPRASAPISAFIALHAATAHAAHSAQHEPGGDEGRTRGGADGFHSAAHLDRSPEGGCRH